MRLSLILFLFLVIVEATQGQIINSGTPFIGGSSSYHESSGVGFGFTIQGGQGSGSRVIGLSPAGQIQPNLVFAQMPGAGFGGVQPNQGARLGFSQRGNGGGFSFGITMAKGSQRSSVTNAPSLSVQNGLGGNIQSGQIHPFATGVIPVVGNGFSVPMPVDNAVTRAINSGQLDLRARSTSAEPGKTESVGPVYNDVDSSATRGDLSVAAITEARQRQLAMQKRLLNEKLLEAQTLVERQQLSLARSKFREALKLTDDENVRISIQHSIRLTREK